AADLDQRQLALERRAVDGEVADLVDRHQAVELVLDLLDDHRRARGDHGDARQLGLGVDLGHGQAFDVVAAAGEQADNASEHAGFLVHQHRDGVAAGRLLLHQTSTMPSSEIGLASSSGPSSISLWAAPDGIIGKQFSFWSTTTSTITGRLTSSISLMTPSRS